MFVASVVNPVFNRLLLFESDLDLLHISEWIIVFTYNKEDCFSSVKLCINKKKVNNHETFYRNATNRNESFQWIY